MAKLSLAFLALGTLGIWLLRPDFFRGSGGGVCGLSLKYEHGIRDVTVQRVDRRDDPRPAVAGQAMAVPCGEALEVRWSRSGSPEPAASGEAPRAATPASSVIPPGRLRTGTVTEVELR